MSILEGELAEAVSAALTDAAVPRDITITRTTPGEVDPDEPWIPVEDVVVPYIARGWVEQYDDDAVDGTLIDARDVRVMVLTSSISSIVPTDATDTITIDGKTFTIINVKRDASGALYIVQARA
jgi:hypothetical protein